MLPLTLPVVGPGVPGKTMWLCVSKETELLIRREWERAGEARSSPLESSWGVSSLWKLPGLPPATEAEPGP